MKTEARASADLNCEDGPAVCVAVGRCRPVGCFDEDAWAHLTPAEARELAADLYEAARKVEAKTR